MTAATVLRSGLPMTPERYGLLTPDEWRTDASLRERPARGQLWERLGSDHGPSTSGVVVAQGMFHPNYRPASQGLRWFSTGIPFA